ncbi:hypothetical protein GJ496_003799, partial [Pomphorhynchus laevis]
MKLTYRSVLCDILLIILICCCYLYEAVKREDFKTCKQSNFCQRQRRTQAGQANFRANLNSLSTENEDATIQFPIYSDVDATEFIGKLSCLADSTFRFQMLEANPFKKRYIPIEALKQNALSYRKCFIDKHSEFEVQLKDNEDIISLNSEGLLNYETFNPTQQSSEHTHQSNTKNPINDSSQNEDIMEDVNVRQSCSEDFNGHHDTNPFCHTSVGVDITFWNTHHVYGIPEHADQFKLRCTSKSDPYRLHNMDVCNYETSNQMALYGSVPYMISHNSNNTNGILWLNAAETWIDINYTDHQTPESVTTDSDARRVQTKWMSEAGNIDVFFFLGPEPNDVFRQYAMITGTTNLPPMFSLGYHQSRWNYFSQMEVEELNMNMEKYAFPCDVIWLDIEYTNGKRYFTWNADKFPNPTKMTNKLENYGRKLVVIVDPHIKDDSHYHIFREMQQHEFYIRTSDGRTAFKGNCWPGKSAYIDFFNPDARKWYSEQYSLEKFPGTTLNTHLWNDMNEPSVFSGPEITINKDVIHFDGRENREIHNIYGYLMHQTTYDALVKRNGNEQRPFVLSRSFFAGTQRADDSHYHIFREMQQHEFYIRTSDGRTAFKGNCWPGKSAYIDFFNPDARKWYSEQYSLEKFPGTTLNTHLWNDMNEPSVFSGPEITINKDVIHFDGRENREIHNIYGYLMHQTTYDALVKRNGNEQRPFVLSRSFFAGTQRAGAIWTGDNTNDYDHLKMSIPMLLSLSVTGISFCGADVGGFFDSSKSPELFYRWFQAAVFQPFFRVHSHMESIRREPWTFDEKTFNLMKKAVELRYSMIPFWYTLFYENEKTGTPPMRPLWAVFPRDDQVFDIEVTHMLGSQLLVSPVLDPRKSEMSVYLPCAKELWYDQDWKVFDGGEYIQIPITESSIPRFQRGGTVIPYKNRIRRSTKAMINDPYTLHITLDRKNFAQGNVFMDDGESFRYRQNQFYYRKITFDNNVITS